MMKAGTNRRVRRHIGLYAMLLGLLLLLTSGCATTPGEELLRVTVMDVEKADCILLEGRGETMLIDTGTTESAEQMASILEERGVERIDFLVLTHMDKDHIGGVPRLVEDWEIGRVIQPHQTKDSDTYMRYQEALAAAGLQPAYLYAKETVTLGEGTLQLLPPKKAEYEQSNDYSVLVEAQVGNRRFLFAGDAEKERLQEYLDDSPREVDFLKVPHHGQAEKNSDTFFWTLSPQVAVITCSEKDPPEQEVLQLLEAARAQVYQTSEGTVTVVTDGKSLEVSQKL